MRRISSVVLLITLLLTGCVSAQPNATIADPITFSQEERPVPEISSLPTPYSAPASLEYTIDGLQDNLSVVFDAEVIVPDSAQYPIYIIEDVKFSQSDVDNMIRALIGADNLYEPTAKRIRQEVQASIDYYESELRAAEAEGQDSLIAPYREILAELRQELESAPENVDYMAADRMLQFHETDINALNHYGKKVDIDSNSFKYEWTPEGRQRAIADGCESITGINWTPDGRKMNLHIWNRPDGSGVYYECEWSSKRLENEPVSFGEDVAVAKAKELIARMGCDFVPVRTTRMVNADWNDRSKDIIYGYTVWFARNYPNGPQDLIFTPPPSNLPLFRSIKPETITIGLNHLGVQSFVWENCKKLKSVQSESETLMPFDKLKIRLEQQLKVQNLWYGYSNEEVVGRRLVVTKLVLSYTQIALPGGAGLAMIPVWDVCGDQYYKYGDDYPNDPRNAYVVDANREREVLHDILEGENEIDVSVLTLNAINGSVVDRLAGY